jgi:trehalose 6-phosphate phosphatase
LNYVPGHRRLWVFDFDGTLSRIVPDRYEAWLDSECEAMLRFLQGSPWNLVAVISSRTLDDLASRVPLPNFPIGGGSGLEWEMPGGYRTCPDRAAEELLEKNRRSVGAILVELAAIPGVEVEDKRWSVAIHFGNARQKSFRKLTVLLQRLRGQAGIKVYRGPEVAEVPLVTGGNKAAGVRRLCQLIGWDFSRDRILYAGDDENDATAIRWVLDLGGAAIVVGSRIGDPRAGYAEGPAELAASVYSFTDTSGERIRPCMGRTAYA